MPVMIFTEDHRAETIAGIVSAVKNYRDTASVDTVKYRLNRLPVAN